MRGFAVKYYVLILKEIIYLCILKRESLYVHCHGEATTIICFCNETVIMLRLNVRQISFYMAFIYFECQNFNMFYSELMRRNVLHYCHLTSFFFLKLCLYISYKFLAFVTKNLCSATIKQRSE